MRSATPRRMDIRRPSVRRRLRRLSRVRAAGLAASLLALAPGAVAYAVGSPIKVTVDGVRANGGSVRVDVCTRDTFLKGDCPYSGEAPARVGDNTVTIDDVPPGVYALQVYHDRNDNHKLDQGLLGVPKEGLGFSRDAPLGRRGPKFDAAAITHGEAPQTVAIRLRHFLGHR